MLLKSASIAGKFDREHLIFYLLLGKPVEEIKAELGEEIDPQYDSPRFVKKLVSTRCPALSVTGCNNRCEIFDGISDKLFWHKLSSVSFQYILLTVAA